jgi:hypothetical protein
MTPDDGPRTRLTSAQCQPSPSTGLTPQPFDLGCFWTHNLAARTEPRCEPLSDGKTHPITSHQPDRAPRVRKPPSGVKAVSMALQVLAILVRRHFSRPRAPRESGRLRDVLHRRRPGFVVPVVVLTPERFEDEVRVASPTGTSKSGGTKSAMNDPTFFPVLSSGAARWAGPPFTNDA